MPPVSRIAVTAPLSVAAGELTAEGKQRRHATLASRAAVTALLGSAAGSRFRACGGGRRPAGGSRSRDGAEPVSRLPAWRTPEAARNAETPLSLDGTLSRRAAGARAHAQGMSLAFGGVRRWATSASTWRRGRGLRRDRPNGAGKSTLLNVVSGVYSPGRPHRHRRARCSVA